MQQVKDVITRDVRSVSPQYTVLLAVKAMEALNVGAWPIVEGARDGRDHRPRHRAARRRAGDADGHHPARRADGEVPEPGQGDRRIRRPFS